MYYNRDRVRSLVRKAPADRRQTFRTAPSGVKPGPYSGRCRFTNLRATPSVEEGIESPPSFRRSRNFVPALRSCSLHSRRDSHSKISSHNSVRPPSVVLHLLLSSRAARCDGGLHGTESFPFYWTSLPINRKRVRAVFDCIFITFLSSSLSWRCARDNAARGSEFFASLQPREMKMRQCTRQYNFRRFLVIRGFLTTIIFFR